MSGSSHPPGHGPKATKVGHALAKGFGVKLDYRQPTNVQVNDPVTRGESIFSVNSADSYVEREPTSVEWIKENLPTRGDAVHYVVSLVPFIKWLPRYNVQWLIGDLIAGITVGAVVVPQSMAYAKLATLPPEFGLYSSFMGVLIYWFFATSKDITIGPVAVMSTVVGNILTRLAAHHQLVGYQKYTIASALAVIAGAIVAAMGFFRLGFIVDFISLVSISAFITGSSFNIAIGQIPNLMGLTNVNGRDRTYWVIIHTLQHLHETKLDAAIGLTSLLMLYLFKFGFAYVSKRFPRRAKLFFFLSTLRTAFVILLYTLISWLVNRNIRGLHVKTAKVDGSKKAKFAILGTVPRGFKHAEVPTVNTNIIKGFASELPLTVIVLLIEHISIAKSFGRVNNYTINPSQELIAIGVTNLLGPFLGAYPATGSFSRTAIKSKAGVRTPLAGVITAIVVLLAIYALTAVFFYIPNAVLSAVIIHAVLDLITPLNTVYQFWRINPLEVLIYVVGILVVVFSSIENGIYVTVSVSAALLLYRVAKARGRFLGKVQVHSVVGDHVLEKESRTKDGSYVRADEKEVFGSGEGNGKTRTVFLPFGHNDGSNPAIKLEQPAPGVFIYQFSEGFNFPNASHYLDYLVAEIQRQTRRTELHQYARPGDYPWNNPAPRKGKEQEVDLSKPTLKAVILDMASVNNVDITSVQTLVDVRNQLDRWAAPQRVQWHLASINNRWTKRALASAGFGYPSVPESDGSFRRWKPVFSVAEMGGSDSAAAAAEQADNQQRRNTATGDLENGDRIAAEGAYASELSKSRSYGAGKVALVGGIDRPFFHIDLVSALQSAIQYEHVREDTVTRGESTTDSE